MNKFIKNAIFIFASLLLLMTIPHGCQKVEKGKLIEPLYTPVDMDKLPDGIYRVKFTPDDIKNEGDKTFVTADIYSEDLFDTVDLHQMKVGDRIFYSGREVKVDEIHWDEQESKCCINFPSLEEAEEEFWPSESGGTYYISGPDGHHTYTLRGKSKLVFDDGLVLVDSSEWGEPEKIIKKDDIKDYVADTDPDYYWCLNTELRVEDGKVVELNHFYIP